MEEMIMAVIERVIELTTRAVQAEDAVDALEDKLAGKEARITELDGELEALNKEYKCTESAWQYKRKECEEMKAANDALRKEVEQLKAKLNTDEGFEEANNGDRV